MKRQVTQQDLLFFNAFVPLGNDELSAAMPCFSIKTFESDSRIFSANDRPRHIWFLVDGIGRYFYLDKNGKEKNKSLVKPGGAFASISTLVNNESSYFYTQTITCCTTMEIHYSDLIKLADTYSQWSLFVRKVYENLALKQEKRKASLLMMSAQERYELFLQEFAEESHSIPLKQVAMYIGITDVSLSRIRRKMGLT